MATAKPTNQTRMIGLRVSEELYAILEDGARSEDISLTAYTRLTIARSLNYCGIVPDTKPRRTRKPKPIGREVKEAIEVLGALIDVRMQLSVLARNIVKVHTLDPPLTQKVDDQGKRIERIRGDIEAIRAQILEARS